MKKMILLFVCLLMGFAQRLQAQTTTEVLLKGDTIVVRSTNIEEVATTPEQVQKVVTQLETQITQLEAQLTELRRRLSDLVKVQALVEDKSKHLPKALPKHGSND